ncbi:MAG: phage major capsid protein, partial [Dehalococcoidia bacterium]
MKSLELKRQLEELKAERTLLAGKSDLTDTEKSRWDETTTLLANLEKDIQREVERESHMRIVAAGSGKDASKGDEKDFEKYSLTKALREFLNGKLTGLEAEMCEEAARENEAIGQGGIMGLGISNKILMHKPIANRGTIVAASNPTVATSPMGFIDAVYAKTLLVELGAQTMSGLTGNVDLPYMSTAPATEWLPENEESVDAVGAMNKYTLTPHRIANFLPVSKLLLVQSSVDVERRLWDHLIRATAVKLQGGAIAGGTHACTGLLATSGIGNVVGGDNGAAPTHAHMLALIREVAIDNCDFGALAFLCSPQARWKLQSTAIESGHPQRVWDPIVRDSLLGYRAGVTSLVPDNLTKGNQSEVCSAIIFGNFNEMTIGQFGALDLTVDNITAAKKYEVNLILNAFYD